MDQLSIPYILYDNYLYGTPRPPKYFKGSYWFWDVRGESFSYKIGRYIRVGYEPDYTIDHTLIDFFERYLI